MNNDIAGQRIRERRNELDVSVVEIAERTGLSKATIHRYESGDIKQIKLPTLERIAEILNVNPLWLIGKSDEKENKTVPTKDVLVMLDSLTKRIERESVLYAGEDKLSVEKRTLIVNGLNVLHNLIKG